MKSKNLFTTIVFVLLGCLSAHLKAQAYGYEFADPDAKKVRIQFEKYNNLIIVPVILNDSFQLNFIIDTGVRHTIITKRSYTDSLDVKYGKKFRLRGADKESTVEAQLAHDLKLDLGAVIGKHQTVLVLKEDYFDLDKSFGRPIDGILGMDLFLRYTVKVDYERQVITLYEPNKFKPKRSYKAVPVFMDQGKPYMQSVIVLDNNEFIQATMLIDCGASLSMMLDMSIDNRIKLPEKYIQGTFGQVLGGELEAFVGRVKFLGIHPYSFHDVVTNFQMPFWEDTISTNHGLIGGGILSRFDVVFDFVRQKMYLKKNESFYKPFVRDRSGLHVTLHGNNFNQFIIADVITGSPADNAGIQPGDKIIRCNGKSLKSLTLDYIIELLQSEPNTLVRLTVLRNGEELHVRFRLQDLI